jgi:mono/diheme cytochrome c family protein
MVFAASILTEALAEVPGKQLFTEHCQICHSGAKAMGGFTVASLTEDFTDKQNLERWLTVLEQLKDGNMPPKEKPRRKRTAAYSVFWGHRACKLSLEGSPAMAVRGT